MVDSTALAVQDSLDIAVLDKASDYRYNCFCLYYLLYIQMEIQQLHLRVEGVEALCYLLHDSSMFVDSIA